MSHSCQNRGGCRQQCPEYQNEADPPEHRPLRFFVIVGVATTMAVALMVLLTCLHPGAVLPAIAAFLWVLGRFLGKDLP
mgnify:CR=1 FL=1